MPNNLGHDKIPQWTDDIWNSIDKAVADEHKLTAIAAQFLTPPVPDVTMDGTVPADAALVGGDGVLSVDEGENRSIVEIAVQFKVRKGQVDNGSTFIICVLLSNRNESTLVLLLCGSGMMSDTALLLNKGSLSASRP
jgi:hypothetical protein